MKTIFSFTKPALIILSSVLLCICLASCQDPAEPITKTGYYFDTFITLTGYGKNAETVLDAGLALCEKYENMLSCTKENSDIWNINHAAGEPVEVSPETAYLLSQAIKYAETTGGLIDPTITPLSRLWNFTGDPPGPVPDQTQIEALLSHVDYEAVFIDGTTIRLTDPEAEVDLGFLAKGYIADQLKLLFLEQDLTHALINLGGNVLAVGDKPDGTAYRTGIRKPFGARNETVGIVSLKDRSLVSSGSYERYFEEDGVLYHHILNPFTGYPVDTDLDGVTILSDSSMEGDAFSTTCFLLGYEKGQELIESLPKTEALFITRDGSVYKTSGFPD